LSSKHKHGTLIVLSGPSGVGKTSICQKILKARHDVRYSVSATSRPMRQGEKNNREYLFLSESEFKAWIKKDLFIEYARVHGNFYGTPKIILENNLAKGFHVLMDIDVQGARVLMDSYPKGLYFFIIPPDFTELKKRLIKRNTEKNDDIKNRLAKASEELKYKEDYKYIIENRDLDQTVTEILSIINSELSEQR
jgi:guanylate kinase